MNILKTIGLAVGYDNKVIAQDLNLELKTGQLICLLGQNGVGKSTLLRTLANLQDPLSGHIQIDSEDIQHIDRNTLAKQLGIITTQKIGMSNMTVRELVALGRYPYTDWIGKETLKDTAKIKDAISRCKINYIANTKLSAISDGQFQKAMVARVLAQDTDIILMDEPTAHLDVLNRVEIFRLLQTIKNETGKSILISTHELDLSMQFADQLWLMNFNQPIHCGVPEDLGLRGAIEDIFYHEEFRLDSRTGQIHLNRQPKVYFEVIGEEIAVKWVKKALLRKGYGLEGDGIVIEAHRDEKELVWHVLEKHGSTMKDLLKELEKL